MELTQHDRIVSLHTDRRYYFTGLQLRRCVLQALAIDWRPDFGETGGTAEYYGDGVPCPWVDSGAIAISVDAPGWHGDRPEDSQERTLRVIREGVDAMGAHDAGAELAAAGR